MDPRILRHLRCPICSTPFTEVESGSGVALRCLAAHSFDRARHGYVNLAAPALAHTGDTAGMVAARSAFLSAGHYGFVADALAHSVKSLTAGTLSGLVVDAGAGTGYYLAAVLDAQPEFAGLALDVSKAALRRAARIHPNSTGALCDVWSRLPLADQSAAVVLSVFAPRNGPEFRRILAESGALLVVTPTVRHLTELVDALGLLSVDPSKDETLASSLGGSFDPAGAEQLTRELRLTHAEVRSVVAMGPSSWHVDPATLAGAISALPEPVPVTASVQLAFWRPKQIP